MSSGVVSPSNTDKTAGACHGPPLETPHTSVIFKIIICWSNHIFQNGFHPKRVLKFRKMGNRHSKKSGAAHDSPLPDFSKSPTPKTHLSTYSRISLDPQPQFPNSPSPKAQPSIAQPAPPPYLILDRLPHETDSSYSSRQADIETFIQYSTFFSKNPKAISPSDYQSLGTMLAEITWDSIPSKEWSLLRCRLWIRAYLIAKLNRGLKDATVMADGFVENGQWLVCMGIKDWVALCPVGGRSIWRLVEGYRAEGLIS